MITDMAVSATTKIHFESNSQLNKVRYASLICCQRHYKDTFWKQFTTVTKEEKTQRTLSAPLQRYILKAIHNSLMCGIRLLELSAPLQRYILKAIHNQLLYDIKSGKLSAPLQRYILKAIHNHNEFNTSLIIAVSATTKIHFESNSQQLDVWYKTVGAVSATTKIHFESNSQPTPVWY